MFNFTFERVDNAKDLQVFDDDDTIVNIVVQRLTFLPYDSRQSDLIPTFMFSKWSLYFFHVTASVSPR